VVAEIFCHDGTRRKIKIDPHLLLIANILLLHHSITPLVSASEAIHQRAQHIKKMLMGNFY